ncbi:putative aspartyl-tRNA synthetase [Mytilinidion resinicola]|uniref:Aspartyl-tRNA synthetase n=1 Tax=Mytilinidion resinicola TaxID=574789 RepID=A0A6A6Z2P1_9PEZI|nr:putative aspartyl-tRNA synthetase [Mytilinidion resinicola]KAF2815088.1 putative aspartyl-tRNA synthetase [Mytilinidion resinicola]
MLSQASCARARVRHPVLKSYAEISRFIRNGPRRQGQISNHAQSVSKLCTAQIRSFSSLKPFRDTTGTQPLPQFLEEYKSSIRFPPPTCSIASLKDAKVGETVVLHGYLGSNRKDMAKGLTFAQLLSNDMATCVQIISLGKDENGNEKESHAKLKTLNSHSPVIIGGILKERIPPKDKPDTGVELITNVEVNIDDVQLLNTMPNALVTGQTAFPPEQRHLQIRMGDDIRKALAFRAKVAQLCRQSLIESGFLEIETPLLFKSTPEGAREFLVPTRAKGLAYALPQSPQQYKQILMASGIPKYFQVARCFRDEDLRADRQPEFTQLDLEMSFVTGEDVMQQIEGLIKHLWKEMLGWTSQDEFARMSYHDAMAQYGSDKPDLRLGMKIHRIEYLLPADLILNIGPLHDPIVEGIKLSVSDDARQTQKFITNFMDSPDAAPFLNNPEGKPGVFVYNTKKPLSGLHAFGFEGAEQVEEMLDLEQGDLVVIQARKNAPFSGGSTPLGNLRLALHKAARNLGMIEQPRDFKFLWITNFPLFSPSNDTDPGQGGAAGLSATHHPFTAPKTPEDVDLLLTDPPAVIAEHYDIVVNGVELGGGSRRIHDAKVQEYVLRDILKMSEERLQDFKHLIHVLNAGCPPHAGIALGFDRLIAVMMGKESVRDVIAFPKSGKGEDMLVKSPNAVTKEQLDTYHLQLKE